MVGLGLVEMGVLAAVFIAVAMSVVGTWGMMRRVQEETPAKKKKEKRQRAPKAASAAVDTLVNRGNLPFALRFIEPLQRKLTQTDPEQVGQTRQALIEAGFYERHALDIFFSSRLLLSLALAIGSSLFLIVFPSALSASKGMLAVLGATAFGYYAPLLALRMRINARRKAFTVGLPDALDMILVGVQAGLSLPAALKHVVQEFGNVHPVVAEHFLIVSLEFEAGKSRTEALARMASRMKVPEARTFATMVAQAESLGTRLSDTLVVISDEMRTDRELKAEQKAAELPVAMSVPLVLLVFPCLFLVIMVPIMINILRTFSSMGG